MSGVMIYDVHVGEFVCAGKNASIGIWNTAIIYITGEQGAKVKPLIHGLSQTAEFMGLECS